MSKDIVMISYSQVDQPIAEKVLNAFRAKNISCWVAFESIQPGQSWPTRISEAINDCSYFVLILTPNSNGSRQVERELTQADSLNKKIYCFQTENFAVSSGMRYFFSAIQKLEAFKFGFDNALQRMVNDIYNSLDQKPPIIGQAPTIQPAEQKPVITPEQYGALPSEKNNSKNWVWALAVIPVIIIMFLVFKNSGGKDKEPKTEKDSTSIVPDIGYPATTTTPADSMVKYDTRADTMKGK